MEKESPEGQATGLTPFPFHWSHMTELGNTLLGLGLMLIYPWQQVMLCLLSVPKRLERGQMWMSVSLSPAGTIFISPTASSCERKIESHENFARSKALTPFPRLQSWIGPAVVVGVTMYVLSISSLSEVEMVHPERIRNWLKMSNRSTPRTYFFQFLPSLPCFLRLSPYFEHQVH